MEAIVEYNITDAAISKMENDFMGLIIKDSDDKEGFNKVHDARMTVKNHRVAVEKKRKELKADALAWGKKVDKEAKRIFTLLEPIESHLQGEEDRIINDKERIRQEKIRKEEERVNGIRELITAIQNLAIIKPSMTAEDIKDHMENVQGMLLKEEDFEEFIEEAQSAHAQTIKSLQETLNNRIEFERQEAERKAEAERLEEQRKAQEAEQAKLDEEKRKLQEEKDRLDAEKKAEQERKEREEFERQAKEKAEQEAQERLEREKKEKEEQERKKAEERARREALKPDKDKIKSYANSLLEVCEPELSEPEAQELMKDFQRDFLNLMESLIQEAKNL